jgi:hypothetical protein
MIQMYEAMDENFKSEEQEIHITICKGLINSDKFGFYDE